MNYGPNRQPDIRICIEYDCRGKRAVKEFDCPHAAKRFYVAKTKAGKNPAVKKAQ